ncbi:MAG: RNA-binding cell elongation regulator Jag/EloR [Phascolarctobacterium sp.]|nr:RNA-binding cell elongation regulator Jag/EloR [Phascolarctobacterium sp.]
MDYIEKTGKTVQDAIAAALAELQISEDEAEITVIDQGKEGVFLGLGAKPAVVRVAKREAAEVAAMAAATAVAEEQENAEPAQEARPRVINDEVVEKAKKFLQEVFSAMKIEVAMEKFVNTQDGSVVIRLHGDDMGILIGKHGQTLDSLQYLTNLVANKEEKDWTRIIIDVEDYRDRRVETLTRLAKRLADRVRREGEPVALEPMNPHERKIVHLALQNDRRIVTHSEGEEPNRYIVIELKK